MMTPSLRAGLGVLGALPAAAKAFLAEAAEIFQAWHFKCSPDKSLAP
jgi:hypothetical protein